MITTTTENIERPQARFRTREQSAKLLQELRELYQSLSRNERGAVREHFSCLADSQFVDGEEC
jgi:hypothetical protein